MRRFRIIRDSRGFLLVGARKVGCVHDAVADGMIFIVGINDVRIVIMTLNMK
nr:hypothetical protein [Bacteroidota bacterium]